MKAKRLSQQQVRKMLSAPRIKLNYGAETVAYTISGFPKWLLKVSKYDLEEKARLGEKLSFFPPTFRVYDRKNKQYVYLQARVFERPAQHELGRNERMQSEASRIGAYLGDSGADTYSTDKHSHNMMFGTVLSQKKPKWWLYDIGSIFKKESWQR